MATVIGHSSVEVSNYYFALLLIVIHFQQSTEKAMFISKLSDYSNSIYVQLSTNLFNLKLYKIFFFINKTGFT